MNGLMPPFSSSTVRLKAPDDAVRLPVREPVDLAAWAAQAARARTDDEGLVPALAEELREAATDARTRGPVTALSYVPEPRRGELARIELSALLADDTYPTMTADLLARYLTTITANLLPPTRGRVPRPPGRPRGPRPPRLRSGHRPRRHGDCLEDLRVRDRAGRRVGAGAADVLAGGGPDRRTVRADRRTGQDRHDRMNRGPDRGRAKIMTRWLKGFVSESCRPHGRHVMNVPVRVGCRGGAGFTDAQVAEGSEAVSNWGTPALSCRWITVCAVRSRSQDAP